MPQFRVQHALAALLFAVVTMPSTQAQLVVSCPPSNHVSALRFIVQTGANDLRGGGDNVYAMLRIVYGTRWNPLPADADGLNHGARWSAWSVHAVDIAIPPSTGGCPIAPEVFTGVRLQTQFTGTTAIDAWDLQSVLVYWVGVDERGVPASGLIAHDRAPTRTSPLHRFTLTSANYDVPMGH